MKKQLSLFFTGTLACVALAGHACAQDANENEASNSAQLVAQTPAEAQAAETLRHKDRAVTIMDTPLDGTSVETFTAGLNRLDEEGTEHQYRTVMSALDFLLFYDIGARRDKARLYSRLDGKTPNEILAKVEATRKDGRPGTK